MPKLTRVLALGALLAAVNLASMTTVAHANDHTAITQDGRRPPAERQVGEAWRHQVAADQRPVAGTLRRPPLERQVGEAWRHHDRAAQPTEPSEQPGWLIPAIGVLAALTLGGLAVTITRQARRRVGVSQAT